MLRTPQLVLSAIALAIIVTCGIGLLPSDIWSGDPVRLLVVCGSAIVTLIVVYHRTARVHPERLAFRLGLVLWWFLLCSEALFPRANNGLENAIAGNFSLTAYSEAIFWMFLAACLVFVAARHVKQLRHGLRGRTALILLLPLLCILSAAWAPEKAYSLAWSFKLLLGTAVIGFCWSSLRTLRDVRSLMLVTFAAFAFLTLAPVVEGTLTPSSAFSGTSFEGEDVVEQGRFHSTAHPLVIGGRAGIMALIALLFYSLERKRKMLALAFGGAVIIGLAGAKTAFLAAAISVGLLFAMRRRLMAAFGFVAAVAVLGLVIVNTTAVGSYVQTYLHNDEFMTISGRTDLWAAAWPEISSHVALGHGYVASKLVSDKVGIPWYAGHLHNAMLEALYNNGLAGLAILLAVNLFTLTNLIALYRRASRPEIRLLASSLLSLYAFLFLNGLTEPYFGGQASAFYLMFLALFATAEWLRHYSPEPASRAEAVPVRKPQRLASAALR